MFSFAAFGNDLHSGKRSFAFVGKRRIWYAIAVAMTLLSILSLALIRLNPGIEFRGGSEFQLSQVSDTSTIIGSDAVGEVVSGAEARVTVIGDDGIRVQTETLDPEETGEVRAALAKAYGVNESDVTSNFVGASWGRDVTTKAVQGLLVFVLLVGLIIAAYFRTWKMSVAALIALFHDLIITAGLYALTGFEVTPASVIGFLTILGYSLYDTVVVFDKVRENTERITSSTRRTYEEAANLAVNQTLVRSVNTSVVALLPVASILFIGAFVLGAGTLKDISLALFIGIAAGTYSSIFIATPLLVDMRRREPEIVAHTRKLLKRRAEGGAPAADPAPEYGSADEGEGLSPVGAGAATAVRNAPAAPSRRGPATRRADSGQRAQPKRGKRR
ncbi:protein-export membrane protein SecF [Kineosporia sp. NBRC 101677]|uniref:protein translocase subunit SecF n=1 Tax=Kineosporia sp. NBRC 101677 TaxID=3032197 RepID=UPI0024A3C908|nr:protein translocase subunit SecF [Kineosporia sp. NBRC 101677]GLY17350.1 protein-export membrane protein SecF [Kineosporia sp. NBRC 101677]